MLNIDKICLKEQTSIRQAVEVMNETGRQIVLVVDDQKKLLGTFTDGDLRRALIKDYDLDSPLQEAYNKNPLTSPADAGRLGAVRKMREFGIDQMPLVDDQGYVVALEAINPAQYGIKLENSVAIMAGGLGKRLHPITETIPKALVPIGDRPILELIIDRLIGQGFQNFIFVINHMGSQIEDYFGDGSRWNVNITYVREEKKLGTAGGLSLMKEIPTKPMLIMNCDVLTTTDFQEMLESHSENKAVMSMGVQEYYHQIPYGVVRTEGTRLLRIDEKPEIRNFVNAGMYILSPEALSYIPKNQFFDMPDLVNVLLENDENIHCYPTKKYWIDIGQPDDLERARTEYDLHFKVS